MLPKHMKSQNLKNPCVILKEGVDSSEWAEDFRNLLRDIYLAVTEKQRNKEKDRVRKRIGN